VRVLCAVCSPACETVVDNGRVVVSEGQQEKSGRTQDSSTALAHSLTSAATSQSGFHLNIVVLTALVAFLMCSSAFCENICVTTSRYRVSGLWCERLLGGDVQHAVGIILGLTDPREHGHIKVTGVNHARWPDPHYTPQPFSTT